MPSGSKEAPHVSGLRDEGGMTISRRPNRRPSREKAPGPSNASATAAIVIPEATSLTSCKDQEGVGNQESAKPRKQSPTSSTAIGVRNPTVRAAPLVIKTTPSSHFSKDEWNGPATQKIPAAAAERPTAARNNSRPTPGLPPGNVEYSLCRANLPGAHERLDNSRYADSHDG
jgi:hypothetical protein